MIVAIRSMAGPSVDVEHDVDVDVGPGRAGQRCAAVDEHDVADGVGMTLGGHERDERSHRVTDDEGRLAELRDDCGDVVGMPTDPEGADESRSCGPGREGRAR